MAAEGSGSWFTTWWPKGGAGGGANDDDERILDELGLEMDGNSKLLRDRIFAQLSFTLSKGSLQLVIGGGGALGPHPLLEVEVMQYFTCEPNTYLPLPLFPSPSLSFSLSLPLSPSLPPPPLSLSPSLSLPPLSLSLSLSPPVILSDQ